MLEMTSSIFNAAPAYPRSSTALKLVPPKHRYDPIMHTKYCTAFSYNKDTDLQEDNNV